MVSVSLRLWSICIDFLLGVGNLVYLNVLGRTMLILNDPKDVTELFEKRSAIYSSRMELNMINL